MHELILRKSDGRSLALYGRDPIHGVASEPASLAKTVRADPHFRWHPLRGEWVAYAAGRQHRTFLPPPSYDPLRPSADPAAPTELPVGDYDIAVFDNLFPSMTDRSVDGDAGVAADADAATQILPVLPARGHCEVVVFTQEPDTSLAQLPLTHLELLIDVWARRTELLASRSEIRYVLPFENRGAEVGVTLHHPHGQIYAYPFIPPIPLRMQAQELEYFSRTGRSKLQTLLEDEVAANERLIHQDGNTVAFVPAWARYPYEVWIAPRVAVPDFASLDARQRAGLARALKLVLSKYDALWGHPMPYIMAWYQAPIDGTPRGAYHLHAECYPAYRMRGRLKYLAGTEVAAGMFVNDALPEDTARELQAVAIEDFEP